MLIGKKLIYLEYGVGDGLRGYPGLPEIKTSRLQSKLSDYKLKLSSFGHIMRSQSSSERTIMLGK